MSEQPKKQTARNESMYLELKRPRRAGLPLLNRLGWAQWNNLGTGLIVEVGVLAGIAVFASIPLWQLYVSARYESIKLPYPTRPQLK